MQSWKGLLEDERTLLSGAFVGRAKALPEK
jgi:hypothetical protein